MKNYILLITILSSTMLIFSSACSKRVGGAKVGKTNPIIADKDNVCVINNGSPECSGNNTVEDGSDTVGNTITGGGEGTTPDAPGNLNIDDGDGDGVDVTPAKPDSPLGPNDFDLAFPDYDIINPDDIVSIDPDKFMEPVEIKKPKYEPDPLPIDITERYRNLGRVSDIGEIIDVLNGGCPIGPDAIADEIARVMNDGEMNAMTIAAAYMDAAKNSADGTTARSVILDNPTVDLTSSVERTATIVVDVDSASSDIAEAAFVKNGVDIITSFTTEAGRVIFIGESAILPGTTTSFDFSSPAADMNSSIIIENSMAGYDQQAATGENLAMNP